MPLKTGQSRKKSKFKEYGAIIPTKREPKRPLRPEKTEYVSKGVRVTALATSGKRNRSKP
jgi:hypothetical protein